jgi:hypothetical protein
MESFGFSDCFLSFFAPKPSTKQEFVLLGVNFVALTLVNLKVSIAVQLTVD